MANGDNQGRSRIINPNLMFGKGGPGDGAPGGLQMMGTIDVTIPPEQEEKIRTTLKELNALARDFHETIKAALADLEKLETERDALHAKEST
jgi:hypothetical protein